MERDVESHGGAQTPPHCSISLWQGGTKSVSAISHSLPSGVGTTGNPNLGARRDLLRAMKSHNFYRHCKCAGGERGTGRGTGGSQRATQERAKKRPGERRL